MNQTRNHYLQSIRTAVIKLGTQSLSDKEGWLDAAFIANIASQVAILRERGIRIAVVSSGAIGAGVRELALPKRPTDLAKLQAVAAVGQRRLMDVWAAAFAPHRISVAQILLTREDVDDRTRFLNLRNTIGAIHELGAVPIINENDTVSTDELVKITFGDNDILAALVAHALRADLLVLLSVVDGILDSAGKSVRLIEHVDAARELVRAEKSALGKGGFNSKLEAARQVTDYGEVMIVANGRTENILPRLLDGEELGTLFAPAGKKISSRSRWIGSARPAGTIVVDDGAVRALVEKNKSLLPAGIISVAGEFERGDLVAVHAPDGAVIARGLSNYASADIERIRGKKTHDVRIALGGGAYDEVVHRDNLVLM
ncbi:MAG TPA: glutamate 5-kinase [Tepidisphaeraceae bacterium]|jgi:glutamate 5-kinase|nr:glutamate 5-kinase [Tepidisphaeraceae bacterium]